MILKIWNWASVLLDCLDEMCFVFPDPAPGTLNMNRKYYLHLQPYRVVCQKFDCSLSLESGPLKGESAYLTYDPDSHSCWQNSVMVNE